MKKKFRFTIDIQIQIPETISPELVEKIIAEVPNGNLVHNHFVQLDKHQAFIDCIKNNEAIYEKCIAGNFFYKLTENGFEEAVNELLNPKHFDEIAVEVAKQMGPDIEAFINPLYKEEEMAESDEDNDDESKKLIPFRNYREDETEEIKREIDRGIIQYCLTNYEITAASFKIVKNMSPRMKTTKDGLS